MPEGFPPVANERSRIVILGTMPGEASLEKREYYGHPRNHFWPLLYAVLGGGEPAAVYADRLAFARAHGVALWDVLRDCEREGSLDASIRRPQANDFVAFFAQHPMVRSVFCNGSAAERLFRTHVLAQPGAVPPGLPLVRLPSSSPAHTLPFAQKLDAWRAVAEALEL